MIKTHNNIYYFPTYKDAKEYAITNRHPTDRIIAYELGYAIQLRVSGPYVGSDDKVWLRGKINA
jgi:hypothetical protein